MLTLEDYSNLILRPALLSQLGLNDDETGNRILDLLVEIAFLRGDKD